MNRMNDGAVPNLDLLLRDVDNKNQFVDIIIGHLIIEYMLILLIKSSDSNISTSRLTFSQKIKKSIELNLMNEKMAIFLKSFNNVRNKIAHQLGYKIGFEEAYDLVKKAADAGIDFSDDTIYLDKKLSEEWYGADGIIDEIIRNVAQDMDFSLNDGSCLLFG